MHVNFTIVAYESEDWEKAIRLREDVLRKPQGTTFSQEELIDEKNHFQIVGKLKNDVIATAALVPNEIGLKMQRVAVSTKFRNLNIGSSMIEFCETYGKNLGHELMYCHARNSAVNFYLKNGYIKHGVFFEEDGIPHVRMDKTLTEVNHK